MAYVDRENVLPMYTQGRSVASEGRLVRLPPVNVYALEPCSEENVRPALGREDTLPRYAGKIHCPPAVVTGRCIRLPPGKTKTVPVGGGNVWPTSKQGKHAACDMYLIVTTSVGEGTPICLRVISKYPRGG